MSSKQRPAEPLALLGEIVEKARSAGVRNPDAMALATVDAAGAPSVRMVLLRGLDARGLAFFTNYASAKARDLELSPAASAVFYWEPLGRQMRVSGLVEPLPVEESESYFSQRPRGHQVAAWASHQSEPLDDVATLEARVRALDERFAEGDVPLPPFWGGYLLRPFSVEFWESRESRLHERVLWERDASGQWTRRMLQP